MVSISALAKRTEIASKTLRYWESLGLLPKATRSHTGYRLFPPEAVSYVDFIQKSKSVGLSLAQIGQVLRVSRNGGNPCPQVARWAEQKAEMVERQIRLLTDLRKRLRHFSRLCSKKLPCPRVGPKEICCLIEGLPAPKSTKGGKHDAETVASSSRRLGGTGR